MGCPIGWTTVDHLVDGVFIKEIVPIVWIDLALKIFTQDGRHMDSSQFRTIIYRLSSIGYNIRVSGDMVATENLHRLQEQGFDAEYLSVDRDLDAYMEMYSAIIERRVNSYNYKPLVDELLLNLVWTEKSGKPFIDHIPTGHKDIADALAAVCYRCKHHSQYIPGGPEMVHRVDTGLEDSLKKEKQNFTHWLR